MLDKNPELILEKDFSILENEFSGNGPNIILCSKPFLKAEFLNRLIDSSSTPVIIFDFDLLYSGYVHSGLIQESEKVQIIQSTKLNWENDLKEIINRVSNERMLIILDSLNGIYNSFDESESARLINAALMLLCSVARTTKSNIIITGLVIKNDQGDWILSPSGRHLLDSKKSSMYYLGMSEKKLILNFLDKTKKVNPLN